MHQTDIDQERRDRERERERGGSEREVEQGIENRRAIGEKSEMER